MSKRKHTTMNLKKLAAEKAVTIIQNGSMVGLGAGSTIAYVVEFLKREIEGNGLEIKFVTSSASTLQLLLQNKFRVQPIEYAEELDIYFDGCDQVDKQLNALKSGGGIHTHEKLLATMAHEFVLLGDASKYITKFDEKFPLVIEILPQATQFVTAQIQKTFSGVRTVIRTCDKKDGPVITANGNYLADIWFSRWPGLSEINPVCKNITGIVETSLFYGLAHKAIIAAEDEIKVFEVNR